MREGESSNKARWFIIILFYFYLAKSPKHIAGGGGGGWRGLQPEDLNVHLVLVSGVLFQDDATLEDVSVRDPLLRGQFRTFCRAQPYR